MDPRLNRILQNRDKMLIGIDDTFQFNCNQCGKCCMNREDILCTPKDVFRISKKLGISTYDFIKRYCELCRKLECGELRYMLQNKKKNGDSTPLYQCLGGTAADCLPVTRLAKLEM